MRHLVATACILLVTCSASMAADRKAFNDRLDGAAAPGPAGSNGVTIVPKTAPPRDPGPLGAKPADLSSGIPAFDVLADKPIDIPSQAETADLLAPRNLPLPPERPPKKEVLYRSTEEVCDTLSEAAQSNDIPVPFFIRLLFQESKFKPDAVSHVGAQGIAQFMPDTAERMGLDNPFDPLEAIPAAAKLLRNLLDRFGNLGLAAAAYNAGPARIQNWIAKKTALPRETKGYVKTITGVPAENWKGGRQVAAVKKLPERAPCKDIVVASAESDAPPLPDPAPTRRSADTVDKPATRAKTRVAARKAAHAKVAAHHKAASHKTAALAARSRHRTASKRVASR